MLMRAVITGSFVASLTVAGCAGSKANTRTAAHATEAQPQAKEAVRLKPSQLVTLTNPSTTRNAGVLTKFRVSELRKAASLYLRFVSNTVDGYWVVFDWSKGADTTDIYHVNSTETCPCDFQMEDGVAYVKTERDPNGMGHGAQESIKTAPKPWWIIATDHVAVGADGTEFYVKYDDYNHNAIRVYFNSGGPLYLDEVEGKNPKTYKNPPQYIDATWDGSKVTFSAPSSYDPATDPFIKSMASKVNKMCK